MWRALIVSTLIFFSCQKNPASSSSKGYTAARIAITSWNQDYYSALQEYGYVKIYYNIENIGTAHIDYYKVYFKIKCFDGSEYIEWDNGLDVSVGKKISDNTMVDCAEKQATSVTVDDYELTSY